MSDETCYRPFCTRLISNKCSNHCQLDLCDEHLIEHKDLFIIQYEKSFNNLKKSLNELIHSIEENKKTIEINYEKNLLLINENYNKKLNDIEQKFLFINSTQNLIKKKLQLLNDIKNNQALLYQYDIEQVKLYLNKIREYQPTDIEILSSSSSTSSSFDIEDEDDDYDDENYYHKSNNNTKRNDIMNFYGRCPLTHLGIYGLNSKHNLRLCSSDDNKSDYHLMTHFYNYHHIKWSLSYELTNAIINKLNPLKTFIFQANIDIIDKRFYVIKCPLNEMNKSNCKKKFFKDSLKQHLLNTHKLSLTTTNKIVEIIQNKGHLTSLDFDENEFQ